MSQLWQHPFVNVFKHFNIQSWKKTSKEGEVITVMDKTLKCTVYKVAGSIPAGNYILLPKTSTQSLGLTGRYMYLAFRPLPSKYFVVHIDVTTSDGLIVRISFSNLFKEFKSTSTWLQFPFVCNAAKGSVGFHTATTTRDESGPAPVSTRWTMLCLDFQYILSMYLNRRYGYIKSVKLCANMLVKNIYTSDQLYEPGLTFEQVKKAGLTLSGFSPMPRELSFPVGRTQLWHELYDLIRFPSDASKKPYDSIQFAHSSPNVSQNGTTLHERGPAPVASSKRLEPKTVHVSKPVSDRVALIDKVTHSRHGIHSKRAKVVSELPMVGVDEHGDLSGTVEPDGEVHVYAHPGTSVSATNKDKPPRRVVSSDLTKKEPYKCLQPDPILQLRRIVGFGGSSFRDALWTQNGTTLVYPCHAVVVAMQARNGHQRFFIGHTDKVASISMNGSSTLLASGQTGQQSVIRVWKFQTGECLAMFKTHSHSLHSISMSHSGSVLCGVGKDNHGKNMVVTWNLDRVTKGGQVMVMAKAHTDVDICRMRIAAFDDTRMVSCGRDNVRLWRVKDGSLRSAPVNLGEHHMMEFTDCCFEAGHTPNKDPLDRTVYASTKSGHIFEINYSKVTISHVRRILPLDPKKREKQTFNSGSGICINTICVNEAFCVTGSDDGYLRLWPLDFKHVYLEAEHEGPVTAVDISSDGIKILAGTSSGNLGVLDVSTRAYTTVMRSHIRTITCMSLDPARKHVATVSQDHTIRVWDLETMQQMYDFSAPKECPCAISYHPTQQVFVCGFESGAVRVFNVASTSLLAEHKQHRGSVTGVAFSPRGDYMYSAGSLGSLALYDSSDNQYKLLRLLGNTVAQGEGKGPESLAISPDGRFAAFVGPTDFTVSVVDARSLDEVMRIDITSLNPATSMINKNVIDTATRVKYAPSSVQQLLVTTSANKLLKFDARNGRIISEMDNIHRAGCSALDVSGDGRHLATAGDRVVKIWDYHMKLDLNFQVFIGHCETITRVLFTPDAMGFISAGEGIYFWDFLANVRKPPPKDELRGRANVKNYYTGQEEEPMPYKSPVRQTLSGSFHYGDTPRKQAPIPIMFEPGDRVADISDIEKLPTSQEDLMGEDVASAVSEKEEVLIGPELKVNGSDSDDEGRMLQDALRQMDLGAGPQVQAHKRITTPTKVPVTSGPSTPAKDGGTPSRSRRTEHLPPNVYKHFKQRPKTHNLAQRRYTAPPNQAGIKLHSVIGYNGNGRGNMIWDSDSGVFAYSIGCLVVIEDLNVGSQEVFQGHNEEISCLTLQHDCQYLASASGSHGLSTSQICVWDLEKRTCKKVLSYHQYDVICLAYSRDDRFLVSVGDYRECCVVVWDTQTLEVITTTHTTSPVNHLKWDPFTANEFSSVGENGSVLFWLLDETGRDATLSVHEAEVPADLLRTQNPNLPDISFTCLEYAGDSTLFIATNNGKVSAWDTRENACFMHWDADVDEIDTLVSRQGRLVTGSVSRNLRLWSVVGVGELKLPGESSSSSNARGGGLTMEDEMNLDGHITAACFDDTMDMGIVGTSAGTLWYINWPERASIRLVSGHTTKINDLAMCDDKYIATSADDGSLRVWSVREREQALQFQVVDQSCNCLAFSPLRAGGSVVSQDAAAKEKDNSLPLPNIVAGYSDGTVRMFDLGKVEMALKMHPHAVAVTAINFSNDGRMILSGGSDGLVAVSSPTTGMTVRVLNDHRGAPITCIDVTSLQDQESSMTFSAPQLWLATSADRRVSVWSSDWSKDFCEMIDWLTFPAPAFTPGGAVIEKGDQSYYSRVPRSIARFSSEEPDIIAYTGYGMQKQIQFHSMQQRKVIRTTALTHWATSLDISPSSALIAVGNDERLLKLMDYYESSFQDFTGHNDSLQLVKFSSTGKFLVTAAHNEIIVWEVAA